MATFDEAIDFTDLGNIDERTFVSLNSTYLSYGIAVGAVLVLLLGVGLYLYDYYYGTSRSVKSMASSKVAMTMKSSLFFKVAHTLVVVVDLNSRMLNH